MSSQISTRRRIIDRALFFGFCTSFLFGVASIRLLSSLWGIFFAIGMSMIAWWFFRNWKERISWVIGSCIAIILSVCCVLWEDRNFEVARLTEEVSSSTQCTIQEKLRSDLFSCKLNSGSLVVVAVASGSPFASGDIFSGTGTFEPFSGDMPSDRYYRSQGIIGKWNIQDPKRIAGTSTMINSTLDNVRQFFSRRIERLFPPRESALFSGMLLGRKDGFDNALTVAYRNSGLSHLVVASGSNVILVAMVCSTIFRFLPLVVRIPVMLVCIWWYVLLSGWGVPLFRAGIMGSIVIIGTFFVRKIDSFSILLLLAVIFGIHNTYTIVFDASFGLSFLATMGLLVLSKPLEWALHRLPEALSFRESLATTLSATIYTLPVVLLGFGKLPIVSILSNILVAPVVALVLGIGSVAVIVDIVSPIIATYIGLVAYAILAYINTISVFFGNLSFASISVNPMLCTGILAIFSMFGVLIPVIIRIQK